LSKAKWESDVRALETKVSYLTSEVEQSLEGIRLSLRDTTYVSADATAKIKRCEEAIQVHAKDLAILQARVAEEPTENLMARVRSVEDATRRLVEDSVRAAKTQLMDDLSTLTARMRNTDEALHKKIDDMIRGVKHSMAEDVASNLHRVSDVEETLRKGLINTQKALLEEVARIYATKDCMQTSMDEVTTALSAVATKQQQQAHVSPPPAQPLLKKSELIEDCMRECREVFVTSDALTRKLSQVLKKAEEEWNEKMMVRCDGVFSTLGNLQKLEDMSTKAVTALKSHVLEQVEALLGRVAALEEEDHSHSPPQPQVDEATVAQELEALRGRIEETERCTLKCTEVLGVLHRDLIEVRDVVLNS